MFAKPVDVTEVITSICCDDRCYSKYFSFILGSMLCLLSTVVVKIFIKLEIKETNTLAPKSGDQDLGGVILTPWHLGLEMSRHWHLGLEEQDLGGMISRPRPCLSELDKTLVWTSQNCIFQEFSNQRSL